MSVRRFLRDAREVLGVVARVVDAAGRLHDGDGLGEHGLVLLLRRQDVDEAVAIVGVLQRVHHHERALALGDVVAEVLLRALLGAHEVQQVVLDLEREAGVQAVVAQRLDFDLGAAADDGADGQGAPRGVMRGLVRAMTR